MLYIKDKETLNLRGNLMSSIMSRCKEIALLLIGCLVFTSAPAGSEARDNDSIVLTFLGTGAPRPSLKRFGPTIMVEAGKHRFLVDAGWGARERLYAAGGFKLITGIDHILITHLHFDHTVGLADVWLTGWLYGRRVPLKVDGPVGISAMLEHTQRAYEWDLENRRLVGIPMQGIEIVSTEVRPGVFFDEDGLKLTAFEVEHMPMNTKTGERIKMAGQTLGYRVDYRGRSIVFSGDTRLENRRLVGIPMQGIEIVSTEVRPGVFFDEDGLKLTAFEVEHMPMNTKTGERIKMAGQTLGYRVDYRGRSIVFSGDTRPSKELIKHAQNVDVLIHETQVPSPGDSKEATLANVSLSVHTTPEQASKIFNQTLPRMAVYSHIIPPNTTAEQLTMRTRSIYKGPLLVAHDFMRITVGEEIKVDKLDVIDDGAFEKSAVFEK